MQDPKVIYESTRLTFKASAIDPLGLDDAFRVVTPQGAVQMTKAQFAAVFPNVLTTRSYTEQGYYNYQRFPEKARQFIVPG